MSKIQEVKEWQEVCADMKKIENIIGFKEKSCNCTDIGKYDYQIFENEDIAFCVMEIGEFRKFDEVTRAIIMEYKEKIEKLEDENYKLKQKANNYDGLKAIIKDLIK